MGTLLVVTGPPGAGKSTVAHAIADQADHSVLVEGDAFFGFLASGRVEPWMKESNDQNSIVIEAAASAAGRFASGGYTTVYDGVVGPWFLPAFAKATQLAELDYLMLLPSPERCVQRVANRLAHGFSDEQATRKMHLEFENSEIAERHVLRDPPELAGEVVERVLAALGRGDLSYRP